MWDLILLAISVLSDPRGLKERRGELEQPFKEFRDQNRAVQELLYFTNIHGFCVFPSAVMEAPLFYELFSIAYGLDTTKYKNLVDWSYQ